MQELWSLFQQLIQEFGEVNGALQAVKAGSPLTAESKNLAPLDLPLWPGLEEK